MQRNFPRRQTWNESFTFQTPSPTGGGFSGNNFARRLYAGTD